MVYAQNAGVLKDHSIATLQGQRPENTSETSA